VYISAVVSMLASFLWLLSISAALAQVNEIPYGTKCKGIPADDTAIRDALVAAGDREVTFP
jgi:hypothetical protein